MATNPIAPEVPNIDFSSLKNMNDFTVVYHRDTDTLVIRPIKPRQATLIDWNGELWVRVDPTTGEVIGIEVEDFVSFFLKKYPEIINPWYEVMSRRHPIRILKARSTRKHEDEEVSSESLLSIVFSFFRSFFNDNPCQIGLSM